MITTPEDRVIRCDACNAIAAVEENGVLVIEHRHHGERHKTKVILDNQEKVAAE